MFYSDFDEESNSYCVFNTEDSFAYESYASEEEAESRANERNNIV